jgi:hypothetical protein
MSAPTHIGRATFQVNLMLFLCMPAPPDGPYRPILAEAGYRVVFVERLVNLPERVRLALQQAGLPAPRQGARPDLLLLHNDTRQIVMIECKRSWFAATSTTATQARAMLGLSGTDLARFIGLGVGSWSSLLSYVCVEGNGERLLVALAELGSQMRQLGLPTAASAALELLQGVEGVSIVAAPTSAPMARVTLESPTLVLRLQPGEDPRPLYLIPYMPGSEERLDVVEEQVFRERLRLAIIVLLGRFGSVEQQFDLDHDVLTQVVWVWDLWENNDDKRSVRDNARAALRRVLSAIGRRVGVTGRLDNMTITLPAVTPQQLAAIRGYLVSTEYRQLEIGVFGPSQGELGI